MDRGRKHGMKMTIYVEKYPPIERGPSRLTIWEDGYTSECWTADLRPMPTRQDDDRLERMIESEADNEPE